MSHGVLIIHVYRISGTVITESVGGKYATDFLGRTGDGTKDWTGTYPTATASKLSFASDSCVANSLANWPFRDDKTTLRVAFLSFKSVRRKMTEAPRNVEGYDSNVWIRAFNRESTRGESLISSVSLGNPRRTSGLDPNDLRGMSCGRCVCRRRMTALNPKIARAISTSDVCLLDSFFPAIRDRNLSDSLRT